uniref:Uncharacterized protein n=1 Tax=Arundo donax TaxID=35708 RepID=A0A0A8Y678_ARUDO
MGPSPSLLAQPNIWPIPPSKPTSVLSSSPCLLPLVTFPLSAHAALS